jgi:zinc protease
MNVRRFGVLVALLFMVCGQTLAQSQASKTSASAPAQPPASATPSLPPADQILDRYVQAIGGREAWKKMTSRISTGTIDVPAMNLSGTIEIREKAPNRIVATIVFNSAKFSQGFDGSIGWTDDTQNGLREQTGEELTETKRDADFYHPLDLHTLYSKFVVTGVEKINERNAYAMEATSPEGATDKMYFDMQSGLVLRIIGQHHMPEGVTAFTEDLSDYREVDGIKLPFKVQQTSADSTYTIEFKEVRQNVPIEESEFAKPTRP